MDQNLAESRDGDLILGPFELALNPWSGWAQPAETASGDYGLRH